MSSRFLLDTNVVIALLEGVSFLTLIFEKVEKS